MIHVLDLKVYKLSRFQTSLNNQINIDFDLYNNKLKNDFYFELKIAKLFIFFK